MSPYTLLAILFPILVILLTFTSALTVETGSIGATFLFGRFWRVLRPGLRFTIPLIERIEYYRTTTHQHELPDEPENIDRLHDVAEPGKKLPFRVPHKGMEEAIFYVRKDFDGTGNPFDNTLSFDELKRVRFSEFPKEIQDAMKGDSLNAPLTSEVAVIFEWHLKGKEKEDIHNFIQNISPAEGRDREGEVRKRAEDMVARTLQEYLAPTTLGHAVYMAPLFSRLILDRLEILVGEKKAPGKEEIEKPWGIHVGDAYLKPLHPGHTVNTARAEAAAAMSRKQSTIRDGEAVAEVTERQAIADRKKEVEKGTGEAGRIAAMAKVMADPNARFLAELDVKERGYEAYEKNTTVTTYAPGADAMLPLGK